MATGICKSPDSRYWRALYKCALSEIGKTTRAHCRSREGGCAKGRGSCFRLPATAAGRQRLWRT
jgi:hypothetical protein